MAWLMADIVVSNSKEVSWGGWQVGLSRAMLMALWGAGGVIFPFLGSGACMYAVCNLSEDGENPVDAGGVNLESHPLNL